MIKYIGIPAISFSEFPDEIALNFNISNCPGTCEHCSEPELRADTGIQITEEVLKREIENHPGITLVGFMGGDADHTAICNLTNFVHELGLKVGMYSGRNYLDVDLLNCLDYYKIGEFRMFTGEEDTWKDQTAGPITLPTSNQIMFKKDNNKWINITDKFRTKKINNWRKEII